MFLRGKDPRISDCGQQHSWGAKVFDGKESQSDTGLAHGVLDIIPYVRYLSKASLVMHLPSSVAMQKENKTTEEVLADCASSATPLPAVAEDTAEGVPVAEQGDPPHSAAGDIISGVDAKLEAQISGEEARQGQETEDTDGGGGGADEEAQELEDADEDDEEEMLALMAAAICAQQSVKAPGGSPQASSDVLEASDLVLLPWSSLLNCPCLAILLDALTFPGNCAMPRQLRGSFRWWRGTRSKERR